MDAPDTSDRVETAAELTQRWVDVLSCSDRSRDEGLPDTGTDSRRRTLWVALFDADDRQLPVLAPVEDVPVAPTAAFAEALVVGCTGALALEAPGGWAAVALERPGASRPTGTDRAWARLLERRAGDAGLDLRPLHLAGPGWVLSTEAETDDIRLYDVRPTDA